MTRNEFLDVINRFLKEHRMSPTAFSKAALNTSGFVTRVRNGGDVKTATIEKVMGFMKFYENEKNGKLDSRRR